MKYPLRMGPVDNTNNLNKFEEYIEGFFKPWYRMPNKDMSEFQIEGEDPVWEIEQIKSHRCKHPKTQYLIKWVGSDTMTYEPERNLVKYGATKMLSEYKASVRLRDKTKSKNKGKKSGYCQLGTSAKGLILTVIRLLWRLHAA